MTQYILASFIVLIIAGLFLYLRGWKFHPKFQPIFLGFREIKFGVVTTGDFESTFIGTVRLSAVFMLAFFALRLTVDAKRPDAQGELPLMPDKKGSPPPYRSLKHTKKK